MQCERCQGDSIKNGFQSGKQRYKCKVCGHQFVGERGRKPQWMEDMAVQLYQARMSIRGIAKFLNVSPPMVLAWLRKFGNKAVEKPAIEAVSKIQLDEVWHYLGKKTKTLGMAGAGFGFEAHP